MEFYDQSHLEFKTLINLELFLAGLNTKIFNYSLNRDQEFHSYYR